MYSVALQAIATPALCMQGVVVVYYTHLGKVGRGDEASAARAPTVLQLPHECVF
jgi:hypothetical protein